MKERCVSLLKRYEAIYGVFVGAIPSLLFQIVEPSVMIPFSWFLSALTIMLIVTWFCLASRAHAISDMEETRRNIESLSEYKNIKLPITHLNWEKRKMKFTCNVDTNILSKGQCLAIYQKKDDFEYLCGIARIMEYDVYEKIAQADVLPLDTGELCDEPPPSKENALLNPILDYDILALFIKQRTEVNDE